MEFREGDAISPPAEDATFDGAWCVQVLEYVPDATGAFAPMRRALRSGGRTVVRRSTRFINGENFHVPEHQQGHRPLILVVDADPRLRDVVPISGSRPAGP